MASSWKLFSFLIAILSPFHEIIAAMDTINNSQSITDGESLVSSGGRFELGFFNPGNSSYRYLGLWYRNQPARTIVWVANKVAPLKNRRGVLRVIHPGLLVLLNDTNHTVWSTNATRSVSNPVAQLLDNGNVVVRDLNDDGRPENVLWQSFDYMTDTYLPGMKFGWNLVTGFETFLSSWKSMDDPAPGRFSFRLVLDGYPQMALKDGASVVFRTGPWNGKGFGGIHTVNDNPATAFNLTFVMNEREVVHTEEALNSSDVFRATLDPAGIMRRHSWVEQTQWWSSYSTIPLDRCNGYGFCGANGICSVGDISPPCGCLEGFVPKDTDAWNRSEWKNTGCIRRSNLSCEGDFFLKYSGVKLPDATHSWPKTNATLEECRRECIRNCTCIAYAQQDIKTQDGCLFWSGVLMDIRTVTSTGQDVYIRLASSESDSSKDNNHILIASLASAVGVVIIIVGILYFFRRKKNSERTKEGNYRPGQDKDLELPSFDLSVISKSTNHFSLNNKLGEGGFGSVYKGLLEEGQEIAVKRLSKDSAQGQIEFKNEVIFIAKLQHRNLVRLLGCCIQGDEKLLIYEYLPNKSLDVMLFDQKKRSLLNWPARFNIINGIARGLLYLHQDSRLRIIHRDLKASNVLLDADMNPKISDFGIARSFRGNETETKTRRVIGTYGYMSPEYAVDGLFSIKSDVFSFGVLVLEIVSGNRNRGFSDSEHSLNLLGHAWKLYNEGRSLDLVEESLKDPFYLEEMQKSIHVALLCVQQRPEDRPNMSSVVFMLGNEGAFPEAKKPGFFTERDVRNGHNLMSSNSTNEITITLPEGR